MKTKKDMLKNVRREPSKNALLLYSGGLDSTVLLYSRKPKVALFLDYGQRHIKEVKLARKNCSKLKILLIERKLQLTGGVASAGLEFVCPARNLAFLGMAANVAVEQGCDEILIGANATDRELFPDCRVGFLEFVRHAISASGYEIRIESPLIHDTKEAIGERAALLGIKKDSVWSCYKGGTKPCGVCVACQDSPFNQQKP